MYMSKNTENSQQQDQVNEHISAVRLCYFILEHNPSPPAVSYTHYKYMFM